jgi:hypothetical protein
MPEYVSNESAAHAGETPERTKETAPRLVVVSASASVKSSVNSELEGTENSSDVGTEDFQSTAQSVWELDLFGLTLSEVKADVFLVLEELTGSSLLRRQTSNTNDSASKLCGGCSCLTRLMCW